jgi:hypothetical protein
MTDSNGIPLDPTEQESVRRLLQYKRPEDF